MLAAVDLLWTPVWLKLLGLEKGTGCRFVGVPLVKLAPGAKIRLGNNVVLNSRNESNSAGIPHPCILAANSAESFISIGDGTGISGASISAKCSITIGKGVLVGAGACIWDNDFHSLTAEQRQSQTAQILAAPICIEDDVFVGARALILKGVRIGHGAVVGAGSVVARDIQAGSIVAGNPAQVVGHVNTAHR
jgi:acetyltransferase-like isoleucine patch superfamily enzyme